MAIKKLIFIFGIIFWISFISANNISLFTNNIAYAGSNVQYSFNFTNSTNCNPSNNLVSVTKFIQFDSRGIGFISIDISGLTQVPTSLCEGREGILRANHSFSGIVFNTIYAKNLNLSGDALIKGRLNVTQNITASWFLGKINASRIQNNNWIEDSQQSNLNVNRSNYWDNYNTPAGFLWTTGFNATGDTRWYLRSNPFGFFNSSNAYTKAQVDNNLTTRYYLKSNPAKYWNATFATFNKTYADTLYSTKAEPLWSGNRTLVYLKSNPFGFWNSTKATFNKTYADTLYQSALGYIPSRSATSTNSVYSFDSRNINYNASNRTAGLYVDFKSNSADGLSDGGTYHGVLTFRSYGTGTDLSGGPVIQIANTYNGNLWTRISTGATTWGSWTKILNTNTLSASETDPKWSGNISSYYTKALDPWSANRTSYYTKTQVDNNLTTRYYLRTNPFGFYNSSNAYTKAQVDNNLTTRYYLKSNPSKYWNATFALFNKTYADTLYSTKAEPLWSGNRTSLYLKSNPFGFYNSSTLVEHDPKWSGNISSYWTRTQIKNFKYYNSTNFSIINYYTKTQVDNNLTTRYYLKSNPSKYWNATFALFNKTYADTLYSTKAEPLWSGNRTSLYLKSNPFGFYNSSTLVEHDPKWSGNISSYWTRTQIKNFKYYNSTNFSIINYYTKTQVDNNLTTRYVPYTGSNAKVVLGAYNFSVDTNVLFVNAANDRVGIGTATPTGGKLNIVGNLNVTNGDIIAAQFGNTIDIFPTSSGSGIYFTGLATIGFLEFANNIAGIATESPKSIGFAVGQVLDTTPYSYELFINGSSGNVGIGTTNPKNKLNVVGDINLTTNLVMGASTISATDIAIIDDSIIALTTETSGNYVGRAIANTTSGIIITGTLGENYTSTIGIRYSTTFLKWGNLTGYPTACNSSAYISAFGDTLTCAGILISDARVTDNGKFLLATGDTATGNYTFDTPTFHIGSTANRVGIGTITPKNTLNVIGAGNFTTNSFFGQNITVTTCILFGSGGKICSA